MIPARDALQRLRDGNRRLVSGTRSQNTFPVQTRRAELLKQQHPFAIILGCSDSRVPPEIVFDQGLGDLFVVRVAGNIAGSTQIGSVEFAALQFRTRLVIVLGHSQCGAVWATLEHLEASTAEVPPNLRPIIEFIRPSVAALLKTQGVHDREALVRQAARDNVSSAVKHLRRSEAIESLTEKDGLMVVGAEYSLETGGVEFFDDQEADLQRHAVEGDARR